MGAVEGVTEFLPVSSTGHLIIIGELLNFTGESVKSFEICIQLGAILAVCWYYRERLMIVVRTFKSDQISQRFVVNLLVAITPAAILGFMLHIQIKHYLFNPLSVAIALIIGGLLILLVERLPISHRIKRVDDMDWRCALKIGCFQALSLIPGTSRSAATIIGGLLFGLTRHAATEFSFFLAIPTIFAATIFDLLYNAPYLENSDYGMIAIGFITAFIFALLAIKVFLGYIASHDFSAFAWYRIGFGILVFWYFLK